MIPDDIRPARGINKTVGISMVFVALLPGLPVAGAIYFDGLISILDWPPLFNWLLAFTILLCSLGFYLIMSPQRVGVDIRFHNAGLTVQIRLYLRKEQIHSIDWSNVEGLAVFKAHRHDEIKIRQADGPVVAIPIRFAEIGVDDAVARFRQAAKIAGYRLDRDSGYNAIVLSNESWRVAPYEGPGR